MGLIPTVTCRRCRREYSALRSRCPYCGTRKTKTASRPAGEDAAPRYAGEYTAPSHTEEEYASHTERAGTAPRQRTAPSRRPAAPRTGRSPNTTAKWQLIFGLIILAAIMVAVIALISSSINGEPEASPTATPANSITPSTPTPDATITPSVAPTQTVTSITFTSGGAPLPFENQFAMSQGSTIQLGASVYPLSDNLEITWASSDESIVTVDATGLVTAVSPGWATISATCGGFTAECQVWVQ